MLKEPLFYAKILLFGEYGIIQNSMGLSIPYNYYKGTLLFDKSNESTKKSNESLEKFYLHLLDLQVKGELKTSLNLAAFKSDLENGLYFESSIPQGFGVGSSGALVAAIYDRYAVNPIRSSERIQKDDIIVLKEFFSQIESFFHGRSSGIDPLICYLNLPLLIKSKTDIDLVGLPEESAGKGAIFLINSGQPGETQPMVNIFLEKCKEKGFRKMLKEQFIKYNDECIKAFLNKDFKPLFQNLKQLSHLVYENFSPMIPSMFHKLWKEGIDSNSYYLKLCGSGGGGFILGFTEDFEKAQEKLSGHPIEVIYRF